MPLDGARSSPGNVRLLNSLVQQAGTGLQAKAACWGKSRGGKKEWTLGFQRWLDKIESHLVTCSLTGSSGRCGDQILHKRQRAQIKTKVWNSIWTQEILTMRMVKCWRRVWSLYPCRYSKPSQIQNPWSPHVGNSLSRGDGQSDLKSLSNIIHSVIVFPVSHTWFWPFYWPFHSNYTILQGNNINISLFFPLALQCLQWEL